MKLYKYIRVDVALALIMNHDTPFNSKLSHFCGENDRRSRLFMNLSKPAGFGGFFVDGGHEALRPRVSRVRLPPRWHRPGKGNGRWVVLVFMVDKGTYLHTYIHTHTSYIYIYIYTHIGLWVYLYIYDTVSPPEVMVSPCTGSSDSTSDSTE